MNKIIVFSIGLCLLGIAFLVIDRFTYTPFAYVNNAKVYEDFDLTKTYKMKLDIFRTSRQKLLDSLEMNLRSIEAKIRLDSTNRMLIHNYDLVLKNYYSNINAFEEEGSKLSEEYDKQIWAKMNELFTSYGRETNVQILLGANGTGVLLHADEGLDITDKVIEYMNTNNKSTEE
jgi:Skp family chaperone for outer membrane proteins